jgi:hypothetical protein
MGTAYDRRLGARAAGIAAIAVAVTLLVIVATDEGGPWALRLGMLAALAPVAGTLGTLGAARLAAARGEVRALAAIGVTPERAAAGAVTGGALVGVTGPAAAAIGIGDLAALFPRPALGRHRIADGDGLRELALGIRVGPHGAVTLGAPVASTAVALPGSATAFAIAALAAAAVVCPVWIAAAGGPPLRRGAVFTAAVVAAIGAFQAVAAGRLPPAALTAAPLVLLIDVAAARYRARAP